MVCCIDQNMNPACGKAGAHGPHLGYVQLTPHIIHCGLCNDGTWTWAACIGKEAKS